MFLHLSAILFTGVCEAGTPLGRHPLDRHPPWADSLPGQIHHWGNGYVGTGPVNR